MKGAIITIVALVLATAITVLMGIQVASSEQSSDVTGWITTEYEGVPSSTTAVCSGTVTVSPRFPPYGQWEFTWGNLPYFRSEFKLITCDSLEFPMPNMAVMQGMFECSSTPDKTPENVYLSLVAIDNLNTSGGDTLIICCVDGTKLELEGLEFRIQVDK